MNKKDLLVFSIIFFIILFTYLSSKFYNLRGDTVLIQVNGRDSLRLSISENKIVEVSGPLGVSIIEINNGKVRMLSSPCPDKLCVKEGYINKSGQVIVCVPNRIVIKIEGRASLDALTY
ncbi:NusG domain II-containing protein [bacterium]|nr:NusG domain II-containing protein [bacterium]